VLGAEKRAVASDRDIDVIDLVASMNRVLKILAARLDPFHGFFQANGEMRGQSFFGVDVQFTSKAPAYFRSDEMHTLLGKIQHGRDLRARQVRNLG
jgi:hypothetical protein